MAIRRIKRAWIGAMVGVVSGTASAQTPQPAAPAPLAGLSYDAEFFPGAKHDPAVPTPDSVLGFRLGDKAAMHGQIEAVIKAIAGKSPRAKLFQYATSHEGRALYYLAISSESNIRRLDEIKAAAGKLGDPRQVTAEEGDRIAASLPAIAWMAYAIHGDEMSGADASLAAAWHLAACTDESVKQMLDEMVVLIDPLMNPDGRDRCIAGINQNRTAQPSVDDQSVIHTEFWPGGRTNHYLFDMNRDWVYGSQPESRGRIKAAGEWNPHYFIESHEQGSQDTFLFMPPRQPINLNIPENVHKWGEVFAGDQAKAFDRFGWRYYTGEWNEEWYPGYSGSWAALRGAIDNLYEQATIMTDGVRHADGLIEPYREAVHKQLVSTMANLTTLQANRRAIVKDFLEQRRRAVAPPSSPPSPASHARRLFAVMPGANAGRLGRFLDLMALQGIEVYRSGAGFAAGGRDRLGRAIKDKQFDAGTLLIPARQPLANLLLALLELDPRMRTEFLVEERRELLRFGRSRLYDITGWCLLMQFDLEAYELEMDPPAGMERVTAMPDAAAPPAPPPTPPVAHLIDGADDRSVPVAARLMDLEVKVRISTKPFAFDGKAWPRGTVVVTQNDNRAFVGDFRVAVAAACTELGMTAVPAASGLGPGDVPDLGGEYFGLLERPRIAVLGREPFSGYSVGEIWYLLDHELGVRASYLNTAYVTQTDLRRYNVLIVPEGRPGATDRVEGLKAWVEAGGTLIAIGRSAASFAREKDGIGSTRLLPDVLTKLDDYRMAVIRDWEGKNGVVNGEAVWSNLPPRKLDFPWRLGEEEKTSEEEAKRRDQWQSLFMPQGAIVAARVDDRSWMTAGCGEYLPVIVSDGPVLMARAGGNAPLLLGTFVESSEPEAPPAEPKASESSQPKPAEKADAETSEEDEKPDKKKEPAPGWTLAPPGFELRLRMSGLLWPEAAERLAHAAYATRESVGRGQVILFTSSPTFRAGAHGTTRVFANAVIYGPGLGASQPIIP